jgi:hypothetical protein
MTIDITDCLLDLIVTLSALQTQHFAYYPIIICAFGYL